MGDTLKEIKEIAKEVPDFLASIMQSIMAIRAAFGWTPQQAARAFADHVDPAKPCDPKITEVLDSSRTDPV